MLKKYTLNILLIITIFLFSQFTGDSVQKDLLNYINIELPKVADLESEAVDAYSSVSGENYISDAIMSEKMTSVVVPKYEAFAKKLKAIKPKTSEVKKIHAEYVEASKDQMEAFNLIVHAIKKQDVNEIKKANADLDAARKLIDSWRTDLNEMCKKHNVILE